jgi:hypothetical protein
MYKKKIKTNRIYNYNIKIKIKKYFKKLEFGGSKTSIYGGFGVFEASPSYYTIKTLKLFKY